MSKLPDSRAASGYFPTVDTLRGVSILAVLLLHFQLAYRMTVDRWLSRALNNGNYGVVMFFVISGFLITSRSLARHGELHELKLGEFYRFRIGRILPNILLMLALVVVFAVCGLSIFQNEPGGPGWILTIGSVLTFTHNLLMEKYGYFNYCLNILWSLSVEEVFYLTFPILCLFSKRRSFAVGVALALIVTGPLYRAHHQDDPSDIYVLYDYWACFDGIAIGCLAALARRFKPAPAGWARLKPACAAAIAVIYFYKGIWGNVVWGISGMSVLVGLLLWTMESPTGAETQRNFVTRGLRWLGSLSYELYLFHILLLALMKSAVSRSGLSEIQKPLWFGAFFVLSVGVSWFVSRFYAEPMNRRIRARFLQGRE